jgi:dTDP-4-dehydrorhamnose 3,5-epimerase
MSRLARQNAFACASGAILDVVIDLRVGSHGFGHWQAVQLDDESRRAL